MCARQIEAIANHVTEGVIYNLNWCKSFSVAVDESTDIKDVAQLSVFVRHYLNNKFSEDLAAVIPLTERTTGENIYQAFKAYIDSHKVSMHKIISVATDGAPAMVGVYSGFVNRLKENNPQMIAFHCIMHESILCAQLKDDYGSLMLDIMKLINFLRSKSCLRHRQLRKFLQESDSQYDELLVHHNVRWLSKGRALQRVWTVRQNIEQFLSEIGEDAAKRFLEIFRSEHSLRDMAFLTDILARLNDLNLKLQIEGRNVVELWQAVTYFKDKLHCFYEDINSDMNHFPIIRDFVNGRDNVVDLTAARAFLIDVSSEMKRRFAAFDSINVIIALVACPFQTHQLWKAQVNNFPHVQRGVAELELCDLKADILAKAQFAEQTIVGF
ncbi:general transcription factor II-I repeat domain-containing protein 2-like [Watersipora subatra]|uniref:general transcription factor II-I repeat domain-containing protein 2-like n=1 Tax=Watersipora subatra TaxID=2589382 RepID=UPI00355B13DE